MKKQNSKLKTLLANKAGIKLNVGCGQSTEKDEVGMDIRKMDGVDIVHDLELVPYPLPHDSCIMIKAHHIVEHINPHKFGFINVMNEWWRIMKPGGKLWIIVPYAGSHGYWQDPTHVNPCNETTWAYFDPTQHNQSLYNIYKPRPWRLLPGKLFVNPLFNMELIFEKM